MNKIMDATKEKIYFVMPAYNEADNIDTVCHQWHKVTSDLNDRNIEAYLCIANDGSKDGTWEKLEDLKKIYPYLIPVNKKNSGHGATVLFLYRKAIDSDADYVFQTDSDGQTNPEEFWQMWEKKDEYDFQIGHRNKRQDGISRVIVTKVLKFVVGMVFRVSVTDSNTPFRLMKTQKLKEIITLIPENFFLSNVAISAIAVKKDFKINWIPITFKPRQGGTNSINLKKIIRIGIKAIKDFYVINKNLNN